MRWSRYLSEESWFDIYTGGGGQWEARALRKHWENKLTLRKHWENKQTLIKHWENKQTFTQEEVGSARIEKTRWNLNWRKNWSSSRCLSKTGKDTKRTQKPRRKLQDLKKAKLVFFWKMRQQDAPKPVSEREIWFDIYTERSLEVHCAFETETWNFCTFNRN